MYLYTNLNISIWQKILLVLIVIGFLVGAFFVTMALWPLFLALGLYFIYRFRQFKKKLSNMQANMYNNARADDAQSIHYTAYSREDGSQRAYQDFTQARYTQEDTGSHKDTIYDISPSDYTIEEKK